MPNSGAYEEVADDVEDRAVTACHIVASINSGRSRTHTAKDHDAAGFTTKRWSVA
jgi:hypothetical protein